jgi:hypothetical protein
MYSRFFKSNALNKMVEMSGTVLLKACLLSNNNTSTRMCRTYTCGTKQGKYMQAETLFLDTPTCWASTADGPSTRAVRMAVDDGSGCTTCKRANLALKSLPSNLPYVDIPERTIICSVFLLVAAFVRLRASLVGSLCDGSGVRQ